MSLPSLTPARACARFLLLASLAIACKKPQRVGPIDVVGTLALTAAGDEAQLANRIELPDIEVTLRDVGANNDIANAKTQLDGKFLLEAPHAGTYSVCWKAIGIGSGCSTKFVIDISDVFLGIVAVRSEPGVITGKVLTEDGRPCWLNDPFFKLDVSTKLSLLTINQQVVRSGVRANIEGEYAFGGISAGRYTVQAECEKASVQGLASVGARAATANLTLPNRAPTITGIGAFAAGRAMSRAPTGGVVQVSATVRDLDPVEYLWRTLDGAGSISATNASQQSWTLPAVAGMHSVYLMVRDGRGGYAYKRFDLPVGATDVGFSGRVIDETTQAPVTGARVTVGTVGTTTNAQGWFNLSVAPMPNPERYVLNITHPQYALLSAVHDKSAEGNTYQLIRAQTTTHDPGSVIDVVDQGSSGPCGSPGGKVTDATHMQSALAERLKAANGGRSFFAEQKPCRHRGAHIILQAGTLVDSTGQPAQGPVKLSFASLNPERRSLPGDYRALNRNNSPVEMLSFGALYAEFRDAGGNLVNLKSGSTAEIRVPVSALQQPSAKPTISIWGYNEKTGLWGEEGQATLQNTAEGWMYVGKTTHFSTLNMDVAGNDPAQATCVRFELGQSLAGWTNLVLRAYVSYAGTSVQVKETALDGQQYHAIYRIPYAPPAPPPNTLRLELRGTYSGQEVVLLNNVIATDAPRPKMTGNNLWPPYNYSECGDVVTLEADPVNLPYYGDLDAAGRPAFLSGPTGSFLPANGDQEATDYYNTIDPGNATNPTLATWWTNHGFNADGSGGTSAQYLNFNDLGFGRDMNCKVTGSDLACYVTNYGGPDQNLANADDAVGKVQAKRLATVAMEYKASEPADRRVRFYVYGGGDPAAAGKLKFADLDGMGPKPVPHLCTVCHGGRYNAVDKNAKQSRFREFDLQSFKYSGGRSWDYAPVANTLSPAELTAFSQLNKMVHDIAPAGTPIQDLIEKWYPGVLGAAGTAPVKPAVPAGWSSQVNAYHNVYGRSCRTCHVARDNGSPSNYITFYSSSTAADDYAGTSFVVCGLPKVMPNAFVTYKNFWSDLQRVIDYRSLAGVTPATCQ